ncbi:MAG: Crp/Fnr family transcriptional regulator [Candidatus Azobacteroides sp.]|nr:Crp/Fnr family transcriptional regulator [Candidatus Azobacteroides sp.]
MKTIYDIILSLPLFQGIERLKLIHLLEKVTLKFDKYQRGDLIIQKGKECNELVFLLDGSILCETFDKTEKFSIYEHITGETVLFPSFLFGKHTQSPSSVTALDNVSTLSISKQQVLYLMKNEDIFLLNFLNIVSNKAQSAFDKTISLAGADLKKNFAFFVLSLTHKGSTNIHIKSTQQDLADFFGVARPSLLKVINELKEEGIIEYKRKELSILNMDKLHDMLYN